MDHAAEELVFFRETKVHISLHLQMGSCANLQMRKSAVVPVWIMVVGYSLIRLFAHLPIHSFAHLPIGYGRIFIPSAS
jgi:hypothetical protein